MNGSEADYFALTTGEQTAMWALTNQAQRHLDGEYSPDAYNIGVNTGPDTGQTVGHTHLHLFPRFRDDQADPRGGVRWITPGKARYWADQ